MALALTLTTLSAQATMDVQTCSPELLATLNNIQKSPMKEQRTMVAKINLIQGSRYAALVSFGEKLNIQADAVKKEAATTKIIGSVDGLKKISENGGKIQAYSEVMTGLVAEIKSYTPCINSMEAILKTK